MNANQEWILERLDQSGSVILDEHFIYTSGQHGSGYINMDPIFPNISLVSEIVSSMLVPWDTSSIQTVAAPAVGAIELAVLAADAITTDRYNTGALMERDVAVVWADKNGKEFAFERAGFVKHLTGKRVLVVEDLLTTGGSVLKVCREVEKQGGVVIGVSVIVNRGGVTAEQLGIPRLEALAEVSFTAMDAEACELCRDGVPIVENIGHGAEYKVAHSDYRGGYKTLVSV